MWHAKAPAALAAALSARGYRWEDQIFNGDIAAIQIDGIKPVTVPGIEFVSAGDKGEGVRLAKPK